MVEKEYFDFAKCVGFVAVVAHSASAAVVDDDDVVPTCAEFVAAELTD